MQNGHRDLIQADAANPPFTQSFDVITAFDVIEHVSEDILTLNKIYSMPRPSGVVMLNVPAHAWLCGDFDIKARHCRRYAKTELKSELMDAGFTVTRLSFVATARRTA
jgi:2-polyprenyl-3-methyl-5-hydroxy-6-metoxy-1,4-benzoquinol methylase